MLLTLRSIDTERGDLSMPRQYSPVEFTCQRCGKPFLVNAVRAARGDRKWCSWDCRYAAPKPAPERFWPKLDKLGPIPPGRPDLGPCWLWTASLDGRGYGQFTLDSGPPPTLVRAHRFAYEQTVGPIPEGLELDHLCRVRRCVNPAHLEPVTRRENMRRGEGRAADQARRTHCIRGHPLAGENLYVTTDGARQCRTCRSASRRVRTERERGRR